MKEKKQLKKSQQFFSQFIDQISDQEQNETEQYSYIPSIIKGNNTQQESSFAIDQNIFDLYQEKNQLMIEPIKKDTYTKKIDKLKNQKDIIGQIKLKGNSFFIGQINDKKLSCLVDFMKGNSQEVQLIIEKQLKVVQIFEIISKNKEEIDSIKQKNYQIINEIKQLKKILSEKFSTGYTMENLLQQIEQIQTLKNNIEQKEVELTFVYENLSKIKSQQPEQKQKVYEDLQELRNIVLEQEKIIKDVSQIKTDFLLKTKNTSIISSFSQNISPYFLYNFHNEKFSDDNEQLEKYIEFKHYTEDQFYQFKQSINQEDLENFQILENSYNVLANEYFNNLQKKCEIQEVLKNYDFKKEIQFLQDKANQTEIKIRNQYIEYRQLTSLLDQSFPLENFSETQKVNYFSNLNDTLDGVEMKKSIAIQKQNNFVKEFHHVDKRIKQCEKSLDYFQKRKQNLKKQIIQLQQQRNKFDDDLRDTELVTIYDEVNQIKNFLDTLPQTYYNLNLDHQVKQFFMEQIKYTNQIINLLQQRKSSQYDPLQIYPLLKIFQEKNKQMEKLESKNEEIIDIQEEQLTQLIEEIDTKQELINSQFLSLNSKSKFGKEMINQIIQQFSSIFNLEKQSIQNHLIKGFNIYYKKYFTKDFDLVKHLEFIHSKRMKISLEKYGYQKQHLSFDFIFNKAIIQDWQNKTQLNLSLESFKSIQQQSSSLQSLQCKLTKYFSIEHLKLSKQLYLQLINNELSEFIIDQPTHQSSILVTSLYSQLCLILYTYIDSINQLQ